MQAVYAIVCRNVWDSLVLRILRVHDIFLRECVDVWSSFVFYTFDEIVYTWPYITHYSKLAFAQYLKRTDAHFLKRIVAHHLFFRNAFIHRIHSNRFSSDQRVGVSDVDVAVALLLMLS